VCSSAAFVIDCSALEDLLRRERHPGERAGGPRIPRVAVAYALDEAPLDTIQTFGWSSPNSRLKKPRKNPEKDLRRR
jgi:hypothetical protein